jgi:hypothetical protein
MAKTKNLAQERALTLKQRRAFLKLPLAERRRRMAAQAARMAKHYRGRAKTAEREVWQGGDIVET